MYTYMKSYNSKYPVTPASSKCIVRDTEVCEGIAIIRGRFVTIYGD